MELKKDNLVTLTLKGDEVDRFYDIVEKCVVEDSKTGFSRKVFTEKERELLTQIKDKRED